MCFEYYLVGKRGFSMTTRVPIAFSEIEMAFDFVGSGGLSLNEAWICRETGRIWYVADDDIEDEPLPEDLGDSDRYIAIPEKRELDLGVALVMDFVAEAMPEQEGRVRTMFSRPGAYGRFKDFLEDVGKLEAWYAFENRATRRAILGWCEEEGIQLKDVPDFETD